MKFAATLMMLPALTSAATRKVLESGETVFGGSLCTASDTARDVSYLAEAECTFTGNVLTVDIDWSLELTDDSTMNWAITEGVDYCGEPKDPSFFYANGQLHDNPGNPVTGKGHYNGYNQPKFCVQFHNKNLWDHAWVTYKVNFQANFATEEEADLDIAARKAASARSILDNITPTNLRSGSVGKIRDAVEEILSLKDSSCGPVAPPYYSCSATGPDYNCGASVTINGCHYCCCNHLGTYTDEDYCNANDADTLAHDLEVQLKEHADSGKDCVPCVNGFQCPAGYPNIYISSTCTCCDS